MKKLFLIAAVCFASHTCLAQITNLFINSNPPGALLSWSNKDLTYIVAQGAAGGVDTAVIKTTLKTSDGTVVATTDLAKAKVRKLFVSGTGVAVFYAADVIPLETMVFTGKYKVSMDRSGKLPAGTYQICVQLVRPISFQPVSQERCSFFTVASFQLPIPMMPANETILDIEKAKATITFRWTPVAPRPAEILTYRVTVFEILPNQTPMQALRSNQPLLAKDIVGTTQYIWQPQLGLTMCCGYPWWRGDTVYKIAHTGDETMSEKKLKSEDKTMNEKNMKKDSGNINHGDKAIKKDTSNRGMGPDMLPDPGLMRKKNDSTKIPTPEPDMDPDAYAFIWTIQTLDSRGVPFGDGNINGDGISEPNIFFIDRRPPAMRKSGPPARTINLNNKVKRN